MKRRTFSTLLLTAVAAAWSGAHYCAAQAVPRKVWRAVRMGRFPGRLRTLDERDVKRPAKWRG